MSEELSGAVGYDVPRGTCEKLQAYLALLIEHNQQQNLISKATVQDAWTRHIVDSAQLLAHGPEGHRQWLDIGSGAGLPGIVLAILLDSPITLVEPRRLRVEFLRYCITELQLGNAAVVPAKVESASGRFDVITARAVASIDKLFASASHLAHRETRWILPKGRSGAKELAEAQASWQGRFSLKPSVTADDATILVADGIAPVGRSRGRG